jgi:SAM-dependent methyltransferase
MIKNYLWNSVQIVFGAPEFKKKLYRSVLHPPGRLLDFGCASGHIASAFLEFDYYGVDIDPAVIQVAEASFKEHPNAHFIAADICSRPFDEGYFDEILFAGTAHHLPDDLFGPILKNLHFCLKPRGVIHLFDPVLQPKDGLGQKFMRHIFDRGKHPRTREQLVNLIAPLDIFEIGKASFHPPYGQLITDCDVLYLPLQKSAASVATVRP